MTGESEFIYLIEPVREGMVEKPTEEEAAAVSEHAEYLMRLTEQGVVVLAGRTTGPPHVGLVIFRAADRAEAEAIMHDDPAVKAGVFAARLQPFRIALLQGGA